MQAESQKNIKIIPFKPHDQNRAIEFKDIFNQTSTELVEEGLDYQFYIEILFHNDVLKPQNWIFQFIGEQNSVYQGKVIKGMLSFPDTYPTDYPIFYFSKIENYQGNDGIPIHENIYKNGLLCIPMLSSKAWNPTTKPIDILKAISYIFHNPNPKDLANQYFPKDPIQIAKTRQELADSLDEE